MVVISCRYVDNTMPGLQDGLFMRVASGENGLGIVSLLGLLVDFINVLESRTSRCVCGMRVMIAKVAL